MFDTTDTTGRTSAGNMTFLIRFAVDDEHTRAVRE